MDEILEAKAVVMGSPTLNNNIFPTVADILTYMRGLRPLNRIGAVFGSFGWGGESVKILEKEFTDMKFAMVGPPLKHQYVPDAPALDAAVAFGRQIAAAIKDAR